MFHFYPKPHSRTTPPKRPSVPTVRTDSFHSYRRRRRRRCRTRSPVPLYQWVAPTPDTLYWSPSPPPSHRLALSVRRHLPISVLVCTTEKSVRNAWQYMVSRRRTASCTRPSCADSFRRRSARSDTCRGRDGTPSDTRSHGSETGANTRECEVNADWKGLRKRVMAAVHWLRTICT